MGLVGGRLSKMMGGERLPVGQGRLRTLPHPLREKAE